MDINLKGKKAFVCGSTQGIGKAAAVELANLGASIVLLARNEDSLKQVKDELDSVAKSASRLYRRRFFRTDELKNEVGEYLERKRSARFIF